jgi:hypothetical protein
MMSQPEFPRRFVLLGASLFVAGALPMTFTWRALAFPAEIQVVAKVSVGRFPTLIVQCREPAQ